MASFCFIFVLLQDKYSTNLTRNDKSVDGVLGTRIRGGTMIGSRAMTPPTVIGFVAVAIIRIPIDISGCKLCQCWTLQSSPRLHHEGEGSGPCKHKLNSSMHCLCVPLSSFLYLFLIQVSVQNFPCITYACPNQFFYL